MHMDISQGNFCANLCSQKPQTRWSTLMEPRSFYTYHKNPSVWTRCLGKNTGKSINSKISQVLPMLRHHLGMFPFFLQVTSEGSTHKFPIHFLTLMCWIILTMMNANFNPFLRQSNHHLELELSTKNPFLHHFAMTITVISEFFRTFPQFVSDNYGPPPCD